MLGVLRQQRTNLQTLKNRNHREAKNEEEGWKQITEGALIHGFGEGSHNLLPYYRARSAGIHNLMGVSDHQQQLNFRKELKSLKPLSSFQSQSMKAPFRSLLSKGAYEAGDQFAFL